MAEGEPIRRVKYSTWNVVAVLVFAAMAFADVVAILADHPRHPFLWIVGACTAAAFTWGVRERRRRRPSWLLPRIFLLVAIPSGLVLFTTGDLTVFGLGAIWLLILPALLSGQWLDRWFGAPPHPAPAP